MSFEIDIFTFTAADEDATNALGKALAVSLLAALPDQTVVIALIGTLGAGKTKLVRAVAEAAGVENATVASPTFVLVHEYEGRVPIYHFDVYRLKNEAEFSAIGAEEYFARPSWSFIEWADRVSELLPQDRLEISIETMNWSTRIFSIRALGSLHAKALAELNRRLS
jgi:tRNA threonylcarbamoyladenosine biosynthesis protein TsaE